MSENAAMEPVEMDDSVSEVDETLPPMEEHMDSEIPDIVNGDDQTPETVIDEDNIDELPNDDQPEEDQ